MISEETSQILIAWLSEYAYCPRRFYMKVLEKTNSINEFIVSGDIAHSAVTTSKIERRKGLIKATSFQVYSHDLNLYGICDLVEFINDESGVEIPRIGNKKYKILPIEYKRGKIKKAPEYELQLVAQAMCLEEMFHSTISNGCLYYADSRQRITIEITDQQRSAVKATINAIKELIAHPVLQSPKFMKRCQKCSVFDICNPKQVMTEKYMTRLWSLVKT